MGYLLTVARSVHAVLPSALQLTMEQKLLVADVIYKLESTVILLGIDEDVPPAAAAARKEA